MSRKSRLRRENGGRLSLPTRVFVCVMCELPGGRIPLAGKRSAAATLRRVPGTFRQADGQEIRAYYHDQKVLPCQLMFAQSSPKAD